MHRLASEIDLWVDFFLSCKFKVLSITFLKMREHVPEMKSTTGFTYFPVIFLWVMVSFFDRSMYFPNEWNKNSPSVKNEGAFEQCTARSVRGIMSECEGVHPWMFAQFGVKL